MNIDAENVHTTLQTYKRIIQHDKLFGATYKINVMLNINKIKKPNDHLNKMRKKNTLQNPTSF